MSANTLKLRLHIKVLRCPDGNLANTHENIDKMVRGMQEVYSTASIEVEEIGPREILENSTHLADLFLTPCNGTLPLSTQHEELFNFRSGVGEKDIVAYFVRSMPSCNCDGCASHPRDKHGVMIARGASKWTLAHEVGHLFLDFNHVDDVTNLMIGTTTHDIEDPPPDLTQDQMEQMQASGEIQGLLKEHTPSTVAPAILSIGAEESAPPARPVEKRSRSARRAIAQPDNSIAMTREQVRAVLHPDEPNLEQAAAVWGTQVLPHLEEIVREEDLRLAPKAVNLAALIKGEKSLEIIRLAAKSKEPVIRIAAAYNLRHLNLDDVADLLGLFLDDRDLGVRKFAILVTEKYVPPGMQSKIEELTKADPSPYIRQISEQALATFRSPAWWRRVYNRWFN